MNKAYSFLFTLFCTIPFCSYSMFRGMRQAAPTVALAARWGTTPVRAKSKYALYAKGECQPDSNYRKALKQLFDVVERERQIELRNASGRKARAKINTRYNHMSTALHLTQAYVKYHFGPKK